MARLFRAVSYVLPSFYVGHSSILHEQVDLGLVQAGLGPV